VRGGRLVDRHKLYRVLLTLLSAEGENLEMVQSDNSSELLFPVSADCWRPTRQVVSGRNLPLV
jgi:hypothetical protein